MKNTATIYTDGSRHRSLGTGGWGAVIIHNNDIRNMVDLCGTMRRDETINCIELTAAIKALQALKAPTKVKLHTDNNNLHVGISQFIHRWKSNGWVNNKGRKIQDKALWLQLDELTKIHEIEFIWVKAHSNNELNDRADALAKKGRLIAERNLALHSAA